MPNAKPLVSLETTEKQDSKLLYNPEDTTVFCVCASVCGGVSIHVYMFCMCAPTGGGQRLMPGYRALYATCEC